MFESRRVLLRTLERQQATHSAQISELLAVIAHLAGRPLPVYEPPPVFVEDEDADRYVARPELDPDS